VDVSTVSKLNCKVENGSISFPHLLYSIVGNYGAVNIDYAVNVDRRLRLYNNPVGFNTPVTKLS
jgi:hypothetical protein